MVEFLTEQLVKRKHTLSTNLKKILMILITISSLLLGFVHYYLVWVTAVLVVLDIILIPRMNVEFEYIYFNGDLDIDMIMNKQSRKRVFSTNIKDLEILAPAGDERLCTYRNLKVLDFSSQDPDAQIYEMVGLSKGEMVKILFEPNDKILKTMKNMAPRKVCI